MSRRLFLTLVFLAGAVVSADVVLVTDGEPVSEIVIAEDAIRGVTLAAEDLQRHLALISGATLPIVSGPSTDVKSQVYVGESPFTRELGFRPTPFEGSGLEILARANALILTGPTRQREASPYQQSRADYRYLKGSAITGDVLSKPDNFPSPGLRAWQ